MNTIVQLFLEKYIDLIDQEAWDSFFLYTLNPDTGLQNKDVRELLHLLDEANILIPENTRKEVFTNYLAECLQEYMQSEETLPVVIFLRTYCEHTIGYTEDEAAEILEENSIYFDIELLDDFGTNPPLTQRLIVSRG